MSDVPIDSVAATPGEPHRDLPWWRFGLLAAFIGMVACGYVAASVWSSWQTKHPELLLALSSRVRFLLFTRAGGIDAVPFFTIGALRIAAAAFVCYGIGFVYQERAIRWFRMFLGVSDDAAESMTRGFAKARWVVIPFFVGSNLVCAVAGLTRTSLKQFAALLAVGIAGRLTLYWVLAEQFKGPLERFVNWSSGNSSWLIPLSIALVVVTIVHNLRQGRGK